MASVATVVDARNNPRDVSGMSRGCREASLRKKKCQKKSRFLLKFFASNHVFSSSTGSRRSMNPHSQVRERMIRAFEKSIRVSSRAKSSPFCAPKAAPRTQMHVLWRGDYPVAATHKKLNHGRQFTTKLPSSTWLLYFNVDIEVNVPGRPRAQ